MKDLPYHVQVHKSKHYLAEAWCQEYLGPRWEAMGNKTGTWCCFWAGRKNYAGYDYYFADSYDSIVFALKWA